MMPLEVGTEERDSRLRRAGAYLHPDMGSPLPQPNNVAVLPGITDLMDFTL